MFEKDAENYQQEVIAKRDYPHSIALDWQKGAEFAYNKANEWHYPSRGEYPKEGQLVLGIYQPSKDYTPTMFVYYEKELDCWSNQMGDTEYHNIYAWKEIVLPKESE